MLNLKYCTDALIVNNAFFLYSTKQKKKREREMYLSSYVGKIDKEIQ